MKKSSYPSEEIVLSPDLDLTAHAIVPMYAPMDPQTEDVLYGDELQNDMVVLVGSGGRMPDNSELAPIRNRWCRITKLRYDKNENQIYFIGVYADGDQQVRRSEVNTGWLVKKAEQAS